MTNKFLKWPLVCFLLVETKRKVEADRKKEKKEACITSAAPLSQHQLLLAETKQGGGSQQLQRPQPLVRKAWHAEGGGRKGRWCEQGRVRRKLKYRRRKRKDTDKREKNNCESQSQNNRRRRLYRQRVERVRAESAPELMLESLGWIRAWLSSNFCEHTVCYTFCCVRNHRTPCH